MDPRNTVGTERSSHCSGTGGSQSTGDPPLSAEPEDEEADVTQDQDQAGWNVAEWHGKMLVDRDGEKIGKLQDVYVDVETDEPQFATVKEGAFMRP
jgi:hypothetical protein